MNTQFQLTSVGNKPEVQSSQQANARSLEINNLFNKIIAFNYNSKFKENDQIQQDLTKFFDLLLWCEKKYPALLYQLFDMMALQQIQQIHLSTCLSIFFKNYILLMCNCKEGGIIAELLLDNKLPHLLLQAYLNYQKKSQQQDQMVEYIGSYLKSYHRIFKAEWLSKFIVEQDYFQLLQVAFKFFICPEPLTRTSVFNIVLQILSHQEVQNFIVNNKTRYKFYEKISDIMTKTMKNQLVCYGRKIQQMQTAENSNNKFNQVIRCIQDKIALWQDISKICSNISQLFQIPFLKNVLLPLLVGPLKLQAKPLFTIKYSLFILRKLLKTIVNFGLVQILFRILFVQQQVFFWSKQLQVVEIQSFDISKILNNLISQKQDELKQDFGPGVKKFFQNVLRSKDNHFLLMTTTLINCLYEYIKQNSKLSISYGFKTNGKIHNQICQKLISQLGQTHRLVTIQAILNSLILINEQKALPSYLQDQFILTFRKVIQQAKTSLKQKSDLWDFIVQVNEYDLLKLNTVKFGKIEDSKKLQQIYKIVFMWDAKQEQSDYFSFYSCIPDTIQDNFRYLYNKFLIMRKANAYLTQGPLPSNLINEYYLKFIANSPFNPGEVYPLLKMKGQIHQCSIIQDKFTIPAIWIVDENFFTLGHWDKGKKQVKIIMTIKYKHISTELKTKGEKIVISLGVKGYDYKSECLKYKNSITVKGIQNFMHRIVGFQIKIREKQMIFISGSIKKTEQELPKPSLI